MKLLKRNWIYTIPPQQYEISCDECGGLNITWSEFRRKIWCYDCKIDTPGNGGIFDGPIPLQVCELLGITFDKICIRKGTGYGKLMRMKILEHKLIWRFEWS